MHGFCTIVFETKPMGSEPAVHQFCEWSVLDGKLGRAYVDDICSQECPVRDHIKSYVHQPAPGK